MLSDDRLLARLDTLCRVGRRLDTRIIVLLIQVEDRRLDRKAACPSLFDFCRRKLGMSEGTANRRMIAVRLVRRFPVIIDRLNHGVVTLSALVLVKNVLTETNLEDILAKIAGKTRDQIEELVACMAPKPDVPACMTPSLRVRSAPMPRTHRCRRMQRRFPRIRKMSAPQRRARRPREGGWRHSRRRGGGYSSPPTNRSTTRSSERES